MTTTLDTDLQDVLSAAAAPLRVVRDVDAASVPAVLSHFERCKSWLVSALEGGHHTIDDVAREIATAKAQFWPGKACAVVTRVHNFPTGKACQVWLAGGELDELLSLQPGLEAWARLMGCNEVIIEGRKGFERAMRGSGYELSAVCLRKAL